MTGRSRTDAIDVLALAGTIAIATGAFWLNRDFYHDDSFIALRYARNLLAGEGLVWNPGERVQGYTSTLHVLLVALLGRFGIDLVRASQWIGIASYLGLIALLFRLRSRSSGGILGDRASWIAVIFAGTSIPLIVWSISGLESALFTLLVFAGALAFIEAEARSSLRRLALSSVCFGLAGLARPDGIVFFLVTLAWILVRPGPSRLARALAFVVPAALVVMPVVLAQAHFYGDMVPNTFHAKASDPSAARLRRGLHYVERLATRPPGTLIGAGLAVALAALRRRIGRETLYFLALALGYLAFIVFIGGDHMPAFRLMLPVIVLCAGILALELAAVPRFTGRVAGIAAVVVALALCALQLQSYPLNPRKEDPAAYWGGIVGRHIESHWPAGSLVALNTAGSTPYYASSLRFIDMLGLNDRHIAQSPDRIASTKWKNLPGHAKGDGVYVLDREPDYIILGPAYGAPSSEPWFPSDVDIAEDPRLDLHYRMQTVPLEGDSPLRSGGQLLFTYYERID